MKDSFIGTKINTKFGILTVVGDNGLTRNAKKYECVCSICSNDIELFVDKFYISKYHLLSNRVPCGCSVSPKWTEKQQKIRVTRKATSINIVVLGWVDDLYKGKNTRCVCSCLKCNHVWSSPTIDSILNTISGCPRCKDERLSLERRNKDPHRSALDVCVSRGYTFLGFDGEYINQRSIMKYECRLHGVRMSTYHNFVNCMRGCYICNNGGYDDNKYGYFYIFKYKKKFSDVVYKYGITNRDPKVRSQEHICGVSDVEISENVFKIGFENGIIPKLVEQLVKKDYPSCCDWLSSGNTETISDFNFNNNFDIIKYIDLVKKGYIEQNNGVQI